MEDRLLFEHQKQLAGNFGYHDQTGNRAVEQFMQRYYRTTRRVSLFNEVVLQRLGDVIGRTRTAERRVNARFLTRNGYLESKRPRLLEVSPRAVLEPFLLRQKHAEIRGFSAPLVERLMEAAPRIDSRVPQGPEGRIAARSCKSCPPPPTRPASLKR